MVDAHERLRARPDETVDGERPAVRIAEREVDEGATHVGLEGEMADEVACEHDLAEIVGADVRDGIRHGRAVGVGLE